MDGNNQLNPLTYAIVDNEIDWSWRWFMVNLKTTSRDCPNLVFVLDRHVTITNVVEAVSPTTFHGLLKFIKMVGC